MWDQFSYQQTLRNPNIISECATERGNAHYDPFKEPNSNFGVSGEILECDTIFRIYRFGLIKLLTILRTDSVY